MSAPVINAIAPQALPIGEPLRLRVPALDGIRGLAILMVTGYRFNLGPPPDSLPGYLLDAAFCRGNLGVNLFFVLSGFLITGILFDAKNQDSYFRNFYVRRALRILPLSYGTLLVALVIAPAVLGARFDLFSEAIAHQRWLWLSAANFYMGMQGAWCLGSFVHFWSLAIEEQFYLFWPLVIWCCSRSQAIAVCLAAIALSVIGRAVWLMIGGSEVASDTFLFFQLDGLGCGAFLALVARGSRGLRPLVPWARACGTASLLCLAAVAFLPQKRLWGLPFFGCNLLFGALIVLSVVAKPTGWWGPIWAFRPLRFLGKYSYAMYVFQLPLIAVLAPLVTAEGLCVIFNSTTLGRLAYLLIMTAVTTVLAFLSWHLYEKHFLKLSHKEVRKVSSRYLSET